MQSGICFETEKNLGTQNGTQIVVYIAVASWGDLQVDLALAHSFYVHMKLKSGFQNTNVLLLRTATLKLNCGHPELFKNALKLCSAHSLSTDELPLSWISVDLHLQVLQVL